MFSGVRTGALAGLRNASSSAFRQQSRGMKVLAILYKGGDAAKQEPRLLGTVENEVCFDIIKRL
jgi:formate dehydrogenase